MTIYEGLAPVYDAFFPQNPEATAFILANAGMGSSGKAGSGRDSDRAKRALDLGCATGSQLIELAAAGWAATGYEPCRPMLELARAKARARGLSARFEELGMLDAGSRFTEVSLDLALCLGNTLPYLGSSAELDLFLGDMARILAPRGILLLQLLNYGKVLEALTSGGFAFPDLEAGGYRFARRYEARPDGRLDFLTELTAASKDAPAKSGAAPLSAQGRDCLLPIRPDELSAALARKGFGSIELFSGWSGRSFDAGSDLYLIALARKS